MTFIIVLFIWLIKRCLRVTAPRAPRLGPGAWETPRAIPPPPAAPAPARLGRGLPPHGRGALPAAPESQPARGAGLRLHPPRGDALPASGAGGKHSRQSMGFQLSEQFTQVRYLVLPAPVLNVNAPARSFGRQAAGAWACGERLPGPPVLHPWGPPAGSSRVPGPTGGRWRGPHPRTAGGRGAQSAQSPGGTGCHSPARSASGTFLRIEDETVTRAPALKKPPCALAHRTRL